MEQTAYHEQFSLHFLTVPLKTEHYVLGPHAAAFFPHWHSQIEILRVTQGSLYVVCGDTVATVTAGEVVFVNAYEVHSGQAESEGAAYDCLLLEPDLWHFLDAEGREKSFSIHRLRNHLADTELWELAGNIVREYNEREEQSPWFLLAYLSLFFGKALRRYAADTAAEERHEVRISHIMQYIRHHYAEPLSTRAMADRFGFSLSYFCRYFRKATGTTVLEYLNAVRLSRACELLQKTELSVTEIAERVGFGSVNYFVRQFRERLGVSPMQFRKSGEFPLPQAHFPEV